LTDNQVKAIEAFAAVLKESKMIQMLVCFWILQGMRLVKKDNKCWQGVITALQAVCVGGYLSSELEGELASIIGLGAIGGGSIVGAIQCGEEAGVFGQIDPWLPAKQFFWPLMGE